MITNKITKVYPTQGSTIKVEFEKDGFQQTDTITWSRMYGQQFYIKKVEDGNIVYMDLIRDDNTTQIDHRYLVAGIEFQLCGTTTGEFDTETCGPDGDQTTMFTAHKTEEKESPIITEIKDGKTIYKIKK